MTITYHAAGRIQGTPDSVTSVQGYSTLEAGSNGWSVARGNADGTLLSLQVVSGSALIGDPIQNIKVTIYKNNSPDKLVYVRVRNSSNVILAEASKQASTLSSSATEYVFTLNTGVILASLDRVNIEYYGAGATGAVGIEVKNDEGTSTVNCQRDTAIVGVYADIARKPSWQFDSSPSTTISIDSVKPTNVQVGSRFEKTDTRKIYHYNAGTGAVALDGTPQHDSATPADGATSLSVPITVGDHVNKALIVLVTQQSGSTTSVKVGSKSLTNLVTTNGGANGDGTQRTEIWYLLDGDITNNASNQVDWVGVVASARLSLGVYSLYNVHQGGSSGFVSSFAYGNTSNTTGAVNSVDSGDFILDILSSNSSTQPTDTLTEGYSEFISTNRYAVSQYNASPSTNNNMFYSNVTGADWAWSGVRIKESVTAWKKEGT